MSFQDELSRNAQDPQNAARRAQEAKEQLARAEAERLAKEIISRIKQSMLELVQRGAYHKEFNKGTVEYEYVIPRNRYLKLEGHGEYNRKRIQTYRGYRFLVHPEYRTEYEALRDVLDVWAMDNQITLEWRVREKDRRYGYPFPMEVESSFSPYAIPTFELYIHAISSFPIDPSCPMDYLSDAEKKGVAQARKEALPGLIYKQDSKCFEAMMGVVAFGVLAISMAGAAIWSIVVMFDLPGFNVWFLTIALLFIAVTCGIAAIKHIQNWKELRSRMKKLEEELETLS